MSNDADTDPVEDDEFAEPWDSLTLSRAALSVMGAGAVLAVVVFVVKSLG